jgi:hypothetical protein
MEYPHAEDGWQNKRKPQSNASTPRCLGNIFSRYGLSKEIGDPLSEAGVWMSRADFAGVFRRRS